MIKFMIGDILTGDRSPRKRQFTPRQIGIAADVLAREGWIEPIEASNA